MHTGIRSLITAITVGLPLAVTPVFAEQATPAQPQQNLPLITVKRHVVPVMVRIAGTVAASKTVQLTAQVPGRIASIAGQEGDRMSKGTILVSIDDSALQAKLEGAMAQRDSALVAMRNAQVQLQREIVSPRADASNAAPGGMGMPAMMDQMFSSPMQNMMGMRSRGNERYSDFVNRESQLAQARNKHKQAMAAIREVQTKLRDARAIAPFDGVIQQVLVEKGDPVQPGMRLVTFTETSGFQVHVDLPLRLRNGIKEGQLLTVRLASQGQTLPASISRIFPVADPALHTLRVEMDLPSNIEATVGQYVEVQIPDPTVPQVARMVIPRSAVRTRGGLPFVFTVDREGRSHLRLVRLGGPSGTNEVVVLSGISGGNRLLSNPPPGMRAGRVVSGSSAAPAATP
uniref:Putative efflux transporter, RND family, MFP subunit n=1 Tax=Magnetococcus massalia (strain MO-1) TaxID=451514 RepID=A0A1S7LDL5_MAGMO|nr:putative efflux transporter, RND family, MFP subunit [Candidatus Magnetococcus massalia]